MAVYLSMHTVTLGRLFTHRLFSLPLVLLAVHHFLLPMPPHVLNFSRVFIFGLFSALVCLLLCLT